MDCYCNVEHPELCSECEKRVKEAIESGWWPMASN